MKFKMKYFDVVTDYKEMYVPMTQFIKDIGLQVHDEIKKIRAKATVYNFVPSQGELYFNIKHLASWLRGTDADKNSEIYTGALKLADKMDLSYAKVMSHSFEYKQANDSSGSFKLLESYGDINVVSLGEKEVFVALDPLCSKLGVNPEIEIQKAKARRFSYKVVSSPVGRNFLGVLSASKEF